MTKQHTRALLTQALLCKKIDKEKFEFLILDFEFLIMVEILSYFFLF